MLKITSIIVGTLATIGIVQPAMAIGSVGITTPIVSQPADNLHAQLIIKIGDSGDRYNGRSSDRYRSERERERTRWEAKRRWQNRSYNRGYRDANYNRHERYDRDDRR